MAFLAAAPKGRCPVECRGYLPSVCNYVCPYHLAQALWPRPPGLGPEPLAICSGPLAQALWPRPSGPGPLAQAPWPRPSGPGPRGPGCLALYRAMREGQISHAFYRTSSLSGLLGSSVPGHLDLWSWTKLRLSGPGPLVQADLPWPSSPGSLAHFPRPPALWPNLLA